MYSHRLKIFIGISAAAVLICFIRLGWMQTGPGRAQVLKKIEHMRDRPAVKLPTLRGKILDTNGKIVAIDKADFIVYVSYKLTRLLDQRWQEIAFLQRIRKGYTKTEALEYLDKEYTADIEDIYTVIDACSKFQGWDRDKVLAAIKKINNGVWRRRSYLAWGKYKPDPKLLEEYGGKFYKVPYKKAMADFQEVDPFERTRAISREHIIEMNRKYQLVKLETEEDKFKAELELGGLDKVSISAQPKRFYPYGSSAAQILGWVKPVAGENEMLIEMLKDDELAAYQGQELAGFKGIEWVCEAYLRGRRGRVTYNRDGDLIEQIETKFGEDVKLAIDIELQQAIEKFLIDPKRNERFYNAPSGVVIIEVDSGQILAAVSVPNFDLNQARIKYGDFKNDPCKPFISRAFEKIYPAGSTIKPLILIAGMEQGKTTEHTIISCPGHKAPKGWPSCWIWRQFSGAHDWNWDNTAVNAIKGSCNIYFSRLADMLEAKTLQKWMYNFGYGRRIMDSFSGFESANLTAEDIDKLGRRIRESAGVIWTGFPSNRDIALEDMRKIQRHEKRMFGIGQGNFRCTVLQSANQMATIARNGVFVKPKLFKTTSQTPKTNLDIKTDAFRIARQGMFAVVNQSGGTAEKKFRNSGLTDSGITVYGKTGSTQGSKNAWFAGFAQDKKDRTIAIAVIVEGGQSGAQDAAPIGRDILKICVKKNIIGK